MPRIAITIINYNGMKFLPTCIEALLKQSHPDCTFNLIDNVSTDDSVQWLQENYGKHPRLNLIINKENTGYVGGANQAIELSKGHKYMMILNPDIVLTKDYVKNALAHFEKDPQIASFTGKVYRYNFDTHTKTTDIDSVGLLCFRNRRIIDKGQGAPDRGQFEKEGEIFGVSGSCPIYRMKALEAVEVEGEAFDSSFFMYKEDVDLAWRLRINGWKAWYNPKIIAYHGRGTGILSKFSHTEVLKSRRQLSFNQKFYAYKNQRLMLIKNEFFATFFPDIFHILWKELLITGYILLREPRLLKAVWTFLTQIPTALRKRKAVKALLKVKTSDLRPWLRETL